MTTRFFDDPSVRGEAEPGVSEMHAIFLVRTLIERDDDDDDEDDVCVASCFFLNV